MNWARLTINRKVFTTTCKEDNMDSKTNSKSLFVKQVVGHSRALCDLLSCDTTAPAPADVMARGRIGTRMLAGSSSLMGFFAWNRALDMYERLLVRYEENKYLWDERVAQVTSELIEKEELLAAAYETDPSAGLDVAVPSEELEALIREITVAQEARCETMTETEPGADTGSAETGGHQAQAEDASDAPASPPLHHAATAVADSNSLADGEPTAMGASPTRAMIAEVKTAMEQLTARVSAGELDARPAADTAEFEDIRRQLHIVDFYIRSIDESIATRVVDSSRVPTCGLEPLDVALKCLAGELSAAGERRLEIGLAAHEVRLDPRVLPSAGTVLRRLITDVFNRSETSPVRVSIEVSQDKGAVHWRLCDNGGNFLSDSRLDCEDQLAFYPGLKVVRKILGKLHSVLHVEPHDNRQIRFEFSSPRTTSPESFVVWNEKADAFAVRSVQLCNLMPVDAAPTGTDSHGEYLTIDNKRVPLIRLDVLFTGFPAGGDVIAVIGSLEKRVAFYVPDSGAQREGRTPEGSIPVWHGEQQAVAQVNGKRVALMNADQILSAYMELTSGAGVEGVSGGALEDGSDVSTSQAVSDTDALAPPDHIPSREDEGRIDVLIVEQSESLKSVLADILASQRLRPAFATGVDDALNLIRAQKPRLIISEFRMPSMAAKVLVDKLKDEGESIPVLVTTSQSSTTADLLVDKLGAAGFLSKPFDQNDVTERISGLLDKNVTVS